MKSYKALPKKMLIHLIGFLIVSVGFVTLADFKIRQSITDSVAYIKKMVFTQDGTPISSPNVVIDGSGIVLISGDLYSTKISGNQLCIGTDCKTSWPNNSPWLSGNDFLYYTGNIGIGTNNPQTKLDVNGSIKVGYTDTCNSSFGGSIRYNSGTNIVEYCNGTDWVGVKFFANCLMGIQTVNTHPYNVPNMNHGATSIQTSVISISGGTRTYQQTFMCDNGTISAQGVETNVLNSCNAGYTWDGSSSCVPNNCLASTQTVNTHNYAVPAFNHNTTTTQLSILLIPNGNRTYQQTFACSLGNVSTQGGEVNTSNSCNTNYVWNGSSCVGATQTVNCGGGIPANASASTAGTYNQTWNGSSWTPTYSWSYGAGTCGYSCNGGYTWDGSSCVPNNYFAGAGTSGSPWIKSDGAILSNCQQYNLQAITNNNGSVRGTGLCGNGSQSCLLDGIYTINPGGGNINVFCDMNTNGGGWTRIAYATTTNANVQPSTNIIGDPSYTNGVLSKTIITSIGNSSSSYIFKYINSSVNYIIGWSLSVTYAINSGWTSPSTVINCLSHGGSKSSNGYSPTLNRIIWDRSGGIAAFTFTTSSSFQSSGPSTNIGNCIVSASVNYPGELYIR